MKRRDFLLTSAAAATTTFITPQVIARSKDRGPAPFTPGDAKRITKVVGQLRKISKERRDQLTANLENKTADVLTNSLSELDEIEVVNSNADAKPGETLRIVSWNTERGRHWPYCAKLIREHPALQNPDFVFLGEMDMGMARSWNKHTTRELAAELQMNYAYGIEVLELSGGEEQERIDYPGENEWGYHGNAILSKYPLHDIRVLRFPGIQFWYEHYQKRLGGRNAVLARVNIGGKDVTVGTTHLESHDEGRIRQQQIGLILKELDQHAQGMPVIFGGDLNEKPGQPLFKLLEDADFVVDNCNEMEKPTAMDCVDGKITFRDHHIDYIFVRDCEPIHDVTSPKVVPSVYPPVLEGKPLEGKFLGDHAVVSCKVKL